MPVNTYSAGMRARLAFGVSLAIDFGTYLIDEVTEIGDERFRRECATAFRERMQRSDIVLVTHNSRTVRQYCDRAATSPMASCACSTMSARRSTAITG
jgi:capsular polysaccharide transport system ATP-binding protein